MRPVMLLCSLLSTVILAGCVDERALDPAGPNDPLFARGGPPTGPGPIQLPSLGSNSEAWGVNAAGTVIVGHSFDRRGLLFPVKWTLQNGAWTISILPDAPNTLGKAVNDQGAAAGYRNNSQGSSAVLWPATGGAIDLGCAPNAGAVQAWAISASAPIVVGNAGGKAAVWNGPGSCQEDLPALGTGGAFAFAVNANGTIIGGGSAPDPGASNTTFPVRWTGTPGARHLQQLDPRVGSVHGSNGAGDLVGRVKVSCSLAGGCDRAIMWRVDGSVKELTELASFGDNSIGTDVNAAGEVAGYLQTGTQSTAFLWSQQLGVVQLPSSSRSAVARAVSDPRPDGTRLVIGTISVSGIRGAAWVVPNP